MTIPERKVLLYSGLDNMWAQILIYFCTVLASCSAFEKRQTVAGPPFAAGHIVGKIDSSEISEASGLAASRIHPGILYTHNDHGDGPRIFAINATDATLVATLTVAGAQHSDWEDIAVGPCKGNAMCIFIGDTGDGGTNGPANTIYRVVEPEQLIDGGVITVDSSLRYNWIEDEAQTMLVDANGEVYIVGNVYGGRGMVSKIPMSAWGNNSPVNVNSFTFVPIHTHHHDPVDGSISPDGNELLIKSKNDVFYFQISGGDVVKSMSQFPAILPYTHERLGEAICWSHDGKNYYTLGEGHHEPLYLYERLTNPGPIVG
ncbi:hypothetical protein FSP39_018791 [Pinctada imbricata]|uniref:Uncharacterized protein n=1 Tax=Pinctada imbricata TaxID=66713 RepID=A0AA88Y587_PINIB|nr:hypothetical protein FSP39_018791 [Pinctada imbricata]